MWHPLWSLTSPQYCSHTLPLVTNTALLLLWPSSHPALRACWRSRLQPNNHPLGLSGRVVVPEEKKVNIPLFGEAEMMVPHMEVSLSPDPTAG